MEATDAGRVLSLRLGAAVASRLPDWRREATWLVALVVLIGVTAPAAHTATEPAGAVAWRSPPRAAGIAVPPASITTSASVLAAPASKAAATHTAIASSTAAAHNTHLTVTRLVVEGTAVTARIRFFRDDLEAALNAGRAESRVALRAEMLAERLVSQYVGRALVISADGIPVTLTVTSAGLERDAPSKEEVAWYILEGTVAAAPRQLSVLNAALFEQFADQQNIVSILRLPGDTRTTMYFIAGDRKAQQIRY